MSFAKYKAPSLVKTLGDTTVKLHGLSLEQVATIIEVRLADMDAIVEIVRNSEVIETEDFSKLAMALITQAPGLVADIIALAAHEPDAAPTIMTIPGPTQLEMLLDIGHLTFTEVGGVKKAVELAAKLLSQMSPKTLTSLTTKAGQSGSTSDSVAM